MDEDFLVEHYPSINELFLIFDAKYFSNKLRTCTILEWSDRMTNSAGICYLRIPVIIRLSRKLLSLRPFADIIDTLLHEMIHAYLFISKIPSGPQGHGLPFRQLMMKINQREGSRIAITHRMFAEVAAQRSCAWRCSSICRQKLLHYGWVRQVVSRPPQTHDHWPEGHQRNCGRIFIDISLKPYTLLESQEYISTSQCSNCPSKRQIVTLD